MYPCHGGGRLILPEYITSNVVYSIKNYPLILAEDSGSMKLDMGYTINGDAYYLVIQRKNINTTSTKSVVYLTTVLHPSTAFLGMNSQYTAAITDQTIDGKTYISSVSNNNSGNYSYMPAVGIMYSSSELMLMSYRQAEFIGTYDITLYEIKNSSV